MNRILIGTLCLLFLGCNGHVLFQQRMDISNNTWNYNEPLEFNVEIENIEVPYDFLVDVEHSRDFAYDNLYLGLTIITPDVDTSFHRISIDLADQLGQWVGTCKGNECSIQFPIATGHRFNISGNYKIMLEQYSREENLKGLKSIELTIQDEGV